MVASLSDVVFYVELGLALSVGIVWLILLRRARKLSAEIDSLNTYGRRRLTELLLIDAAKQGADKVLFGEPCDDRPRLPAVPRGESRDDAELREFLAHDEEMCRNLIICSKGDLQIDPRLEAAYATQRELHDALLAFPTECRTHNGQIPVWFHAEDGWRQTGSWQPRSYVTWLGALPDQFVSVPNQKPWQGYQYIRVPREGQKAFYVKCRVCIEANYCLSIELLDRFVEK